MPARPLISESQWEILLQYMQQHPDMARGSVANDGPLAKRKMTEWGELASRLNAVGTGATKTPHKWRDVSFFIFYFILFFILLFSLIVCEKHYTYIPRRKQELRVFASPSMLGMKNTSSGNSQRFPLLIFTLGVYSCF